MFYHINGTVTDIELNLAVLDCAGVGYALFTTAGTLSRLKIGEKAKLYTYLNVREDCFDLYGFYSLGEKRSFELLLGVSGVGPKAALSLLSTCSPESLAASIIGGNERVLTAAPGIGKKIAQRIILELKDKMAKETGGIAFQGGGSLPALGGTEPSKLADAASALAVLGYGNAEIAQALKGIDAEGSTTLEDIIRQALKQMLKG